MVDRLPSSVEQALHLGPSALVAACLALREHERPDREFAQGLEALARIDADWGTTWAGQMMALVDSDLDLIKQAACAERVPLRTAVHAPRTATVEKQEEWLRNPVVPAPKAGPRRVRLHGKDARAVRTARERMRLLLGREVSNRVVDAAILEHPPTTRPPGCSVRGSGPPRWPRRWPRSAPCAPCGPGARDCSPTAGSCSGGARPGPGRVDQRGGRPRPDRLARPV